MNHNILIVDDDPASLMMMCTELHSKGFQTLPANSAKSALDIIKLQIPSLIIQDLSMPDLDGLHLIQCIRRIPNLKNIPVIFVSRSCGRIELAKKSKETNIDFLEKPIDVNLMIKLVTNILINNAV
ncbi:MAG TPA: response regulator [Gammaproteobacteria bacterium]|jgi:CheY-like chemotaxis protein|nr:response regulator [Gammaproteobacteria bacterium]